MADDFRGRVQVPDLQPFEVLQTYARPVNTMVAVRQPQASNPLLSLGKALAEYRPTINAYLDDMKAEKVQQDVEEGRASALKSMVEYNQAIEQGVIHPTQSPWFVKGYKEQWGRNLGRNLEADALAQYQGWQGKDSDDPQALNGFMREFFKGRLDAVSDPDVRAGLMPEINRITNNLTQTHAAYSADRIYKGAVEQMQVEVGQTFDRKYAEARSQKRHITADELMNEVNEITQRNRFLGVKGADINNAMVDIVTTKAIEMQDTRLLEVLKAKRADGTPGPGLTAKGRDAIARAEQTILNRQLQAEQILEARSNRAKRDAAGRNMSFAIEKLMENPNFEFGKEWYQNAAKADPDIQFRVFQMRKNLEAEKDRLDPIRYYTAMRDVFMGTSKDPMADVYYAISSGDIPRSQVVHAMQVAQSASKEHNILGTPSVRNAMMRMDALVNGPTIQFLKEPKKVLEAQQVFSVEMLTWAETNPKATPLQVQEKVNEVMGGARQRT